MRTTPGGLDLVARVATALGSEDRRREDRLVPIHLHNTSPARGHKLAPLAITAAALLGILTLTIASGAIKEMVFACQDDGLRGFKTLTRLVGLTMLTADRVR